MALLGAQFVNAVSPNPVGSLQAYAGPNAPTGWLLCDGSSYSTTAYPELYDAIGYTYGGSAGTFYVPDLRGRVPMGAGTGAQQGGSGSGVISGGTALTARSLGQFGGDERLHQHTHAQNSHNHSQNPHTHYIYSGPLGGVHPTIQQNGNNGALYGPVQTVTATNNPTTATNQNTGSGQSENMPPFLVTNYIIKAQSDAPRSGLAYGSTPPIVTQLPSNPQFGDVVTYYSSSPYAGYQTQQWNGSSWLVLSDSREYGAWQDWVPSITQSSSISGSYYARWKQVGKTVTGYVGFTAASSGTAGQWWLCSLPVNAKATGPIVGAGWVFDSSTGTRYAAVGELVNGGQFGFVGDWSSGNLWGAVPSIAVASGDQFRMTLQYEAA